MGKYVIKQTQKGSFVFSLLAANGQVIGTSQAYSTLASAKNGVESVRNNSYAKVEDQTVLGYTPIKHPKFELYEDEYGEFRFRLKAMNGGIVLDSESYATKASARGGIDTVKRNAEEATVEIE